MLQCTSGSLVSSGSSSVPVESVLELNPVCSWRRHGGDCMPCLIVCVWVPCMLVDVLFCACCFVSIAPCPGNVLQWLLPCSFVSL